MCEWLLLVMNPENYESALKFATAQLELVVHCFVFMSILLLYHFTFCSNTQLYLAQLCSSKSTCMPPAQHWRLDSPSERLVDEHKGAFKSYMFFSEVQRQLK